jgi:hypothetical protein
MEHAPYISLRHQHHDQHAPYISLRHQHHHYHVVRLGRAVKEEVPRLD